MLDIGLDSSKQERSQHLVQLLNHGILVLGVVAFLFEPVIEVLTVTHNLSSAEYTTRKYDR